MTCQNHTFVIRQALLSSEQEEDFEWVISWLRDVYQRLELPFPLSITSNRDTALINAIKSTLPEPSHLICLWHVNKDIQAYIKNTFRLESSTFQAWTVKAKLDFIENS